MNFLKKVTVNKVRIEASSACQLRCPVCPTGQGITENSTCGTGFLHFENFKIVLDINKSIKEIELSNWGEVFLNPHLPRILEYAYKNNVRITITNGANLNHVKKESLEALVKYGVKELVVALDGASNKTYSIYRIHGNFDKVIDNVKTINQLKQKYGNSNPRLIWQYIVFGHNEKDIISAKQLAKSLNMEFAPKLNAVPDYSPIRNTKKVLRDANFSSVRVKDDWGLVMCNQLWASPQINWDGNIVGCCHNSWATFGRNAFENNLDECFNSEPMIYAREMLMGHVPAREDIPCTTCEFFKIRSINEKWVKMSEIRRSRMSATYSSIRNLYRTFRHSIRIIHRSMADQ